MKSLERDHRKWMALRAYERATQDADEPLWSTEQVRDFTKGGRSTEAE